MGFRKIDGFIVFELSVLGQRVLVRCLGFKGCWAKYSDKDLGLGLCNQMG